MAISPDKIDRLKSQLLTSGISQQNNPLFQVINQLIDAVKQLITEENNSGGGGGGGGSVTNNYTTLQQFLSGSDDGGSDGAIMMINSGSGSTTSTHYDAPLTDGDPDETDLIFADGECIIVQVPV